MTAENAIRVGFGALAIAGAAISAYLLEVRLSGGQLICTSGGCETVESSRYSELAGVPVAAFGLVAYLAILTSAVARGPLAAAAGTAVALGGVVFSTYLLVVQLKVIDAVCEWCVAGDAAVSLLAALALVRMYLQQLTQPLAGASADRMPRRAPGHTRRDARRA